MGTEPWPQALWSPLVIQEVARAWLAPLSLLSVLVMELPKETGTSLLWWAAASNDVAAVKVLLGEGGGDAQLSSLSVGSAGLSGPASASVCPSRPGQAPGSPCQAST